MSLTETVFFTKVLALFRVISALYLAWSTSNNIEKIIKSCRTIYVRLRGICGGDTEDN